MKKYSAIIFDLFDTILNFNFNHLPTVELKGFRSRTTSVEVYEVFRKYHPEMGFDKFYEPFFESYHEFQEIKLKEFKEFPNRERFILMLDKMALSPVKKQDELIDQMVIAHMNALASCIEYPDDNKETLEHLNSQEYKLAIVSNFDYAPTAHMLLQKNNLTPLFDVIVISEEVGWRKPKDIIFETAVNKLGI
nr:HAD-IA family hydrolase [Nitrosopumilaceae archaeon]